MTSKADYYRSLPAKRMAAGVLLFNIHGAVLIVEPTYKETWEIPGGTVELNESPRAAVIREVEEELGLIVVATELSLVSLDYMSPGGEKPEALMFIFSGRTLTAQDESGISLRADELKSFRFVSPAAGMELLGPTLGPRVARAYEAARNGSFLYYEGSYGSPA